MHRVGIAIFKEPNAAATSEVLACRDGVVKSEPNFSSLEKDTAWLTNLELHALISNNLNDFSHLKHAQFCYPSIQKVSREFGIHLNDPQLGSKSLIILEEVLTRVITMVADNCDDNPLLYETTLDALVENSISIEDETDIEERFKSIFDDAFIMVTGASGRNIDVQNKQITLSFPRTPFAMHLLSSPIPVGGWESITREKMPELYSSKGQDLIPIIKSIQLSSCAFLKVKLNAKDNEQLPIHRLYRPGGQWVAAPEVESLAAISNIRVVDAIISNSKSTLNQELKKDAWTPPALVDALSYSKGAFLESIWTSLVMKRHSVMDVDQKYVPAFSAYIKAWARMTMLGACEALSERGLHINKFTEHEVLLTVPKDSVQSVMELGYQLGLVVKDNHFMPQSAMHASSVPEQTAGQSYAG